jgi:hypothetical protein
MAVGIVLTLMGLAFGGTQFPWGSGGVIAPLMIGILSLCLLGIWEWKIASNPFFAHELFIGKGRTFTLQLLLTFVGGMSLYTAAAFWTQQCQGMFVRDPIKIGLSAIPGGVGGARKIYHLYPFLSFNLLTCSSRRFHRRHLHWQSPLSGLKHAPNVRRHPQTHLRLRLHNPHALQISSSAGHGLPRNVRHGPLPRGPHRLCATSLR